MNKRKPCERCGISREVRRDSQPICRDCRWVEPDWQQLVERTPRQRLRDAWWVEQYGMTRNELLATVVAERYAPTSGRLDTKTTPTTRRAA